MDSPFSLARNLAPWLTAQSDLKDENQHLKEEVLALKAKELRFEALEEAKGAALATAVDALGAAIAETKAEIALLLRSH